MSNVTARCNSLQRQEEWKGRQEEWKGRQEEWKGWQEEWKGRQEEWKGRQKGEWRGGGVSRQIRKSLI
jgi:hypothetical protein